MNASEMVQDDQLKTAVRVVREAGFDIVVVEQYNRLRQWLTAGGTGWPYPGWKMGMPLNAKNAWIGHSQQERGW